MNRTLKDPLFHFLILGALLFALSSFRGEPTAGKNEIIITQSGQKHLANLFELTWQRAPTEDELKNLIEDHIKEEIYYREALALGLDTNDTIVRRRMRQKLEFMQEDLSTAARPTEEELQDFFKANEEKYKTERILSFKQVLVSTTQFVAFDVMEQAMKDLNEGKKPEEISLSSLLPLSMNLESENAVINTFGKDFLTQFSILKTGQWDGPITSAFGTHVVYISQDKASIPMGFETAHSKVRIDYVQSKRAKAAENYYNSLRDQYLITIEKSP